MKVYYYDGIVAIRGERGSYNVTEQRLRDALDCSYPG